MILWRQQSRGNNYAEHRQSGGLQKRVRAGAIPVSPAISFGSFSSEHDLMIRNPARNVTPSNEIKFPPLTKSARRVAMVKFRCAGCIDQPRGNSVRFVVL